MYRSLIHILFYGFFFLGGLLLFSDLWFLVLFRVSVRDFHSGALSIQSLELRLPGPILQLHNLVLRRGFSPDGEVLLKVADWELDLDLIRFLKARENSAVNKFHAFVSHLRSTLLNSGKSQKNHLPAPRPKSVSPVPEPKRENPVSKILDLYLQDS